MQVTVDFHGDQLEFEVPEDRVVGVWHGPPGMSATAYEEAARRSVGAPWDFPPPRQMVVPGDHVTIALDSELEAPGPILRALIDELGHGGVARDEITIVCTPKAGSPPDSGEIPDGCVLEVHDPADSNQLAYLATTQDGRRVYLNRRVVDADVVIPVGLFGRDLAGSGGIRGPWNVLFPGLSNLETRQRFGLGSPASRGKSSGQDEVENQAEEDAPTASRGRSQDSGKRKDPGIGENVATDLLEEPIEVCWLLGSQLFVGVVPGVDGPADVIAGLLSSVQERGSQEFERLWGCQVESRAGLVVAGIGRKGVESNLDDLVEGLECAARLVRHGGKIVLLSRATGPIGPSLRRLIEAGDPRKGLAAIKGRGTAPDNRLAVKLAGTLNWADVYLLSGLDPEVVDDLSMVALERPEEARRLVAASDSCIFLSQAELSLATAAEDD
jgi:hypothetical protein